MSALVGDGACDINPKETIELNENSVRWLSKKYNKKIIFFQHVLCMERKKEFYLRIQN